LGLYDQNQLWKRIIIPKIEETVREELGSAMNKIQNLLLSIIMGTPDPKGLLQKDYT